MIDVSNYWDARFWLEDQMNEGIEAVHCSPIQSHYYNYGIYYEKCMRWLIEIFYCRATYLGFSAPKLSKTKSTRRILTEAIYFSEGLYCAYEISIERYGLSEYARRSAEKFVPVIQKHLTNSRYEPVIFAFNNIRIVDLLYKLNEQYTGAKDFEKALNAKGHIGNLKAYDFLGLCSISHCDFEEWVGTLFNENERVKISIKRQESIEEPYKIIFKNREDNFKNANEISRLAAKNTKERWQAKALQTAQEFLNQAHKKYPSDTAIVDFIREEWIESDYGTTKRSHGSIRPLLEIWRERNLIPTKDEWNKNSN